MEYRFSKERPGQASKHEGKPLHTHTLLPKQPMRSLIDEQSFARIDHQQPRGGFVVGDAAEAETVFSSLSLAAWKGRLVLVLVSWSVSLLFCCLRNTEAAAAAAV